MIFTEEQLKALERAKEEKEAHGEIETAHPGYLVSQDTYYVEAIKGVGRIYQQTVIDTYSKVAFAKLYDRKNALVAADVLNDKVIPWFESKDVPAVRILTDRAAEYCGAREHHEYELYLTIENIEHLKQKLDILKQMEFASGSIKQFKMSFIELLLERKSIALCQSYRKMWKNGC